MHEQFPSVKAHSKIWAKHRPVQPAALEMKILLHYFDLIMHSS